MNWYYEFNGEQKGPVSDEELDRLVADGVVRPTNLVWRDGLANWTPLAQVRPAAAPAGGVAPQPGMTRCDSCGRFFDPADVVQISGRNVCAGCKPVVLQGLQQGTLLAGIDPGRVGPAWEQQETLGTYVAARDTIKAVLMEPSRTFATMKVDGGIMKPFWFHMIFGGFGTFMYLFYFIVAIFAFGAFNANKITLPTGAGAFILFTGIAAIWCFMSAAINGFVQAGILHLCLMMCGGARRPYETTFRAICYGSGSVMMLMVIPILGPLMAIPWSIVVSCISLARAHDTDLWRAVLALFLPAIICCVLYIFVIVFAVGIGGMQNAH
jgi:hypothetical protein